MAVPDNGPLIAGVTWFLCGISGAFLGLRLYAKISRRQQLWWDDHILIISWGLLLAESALTQAGIMLGFGKHSADIPPKNLAIISIGMSVVASISCFASTLSKISFGVTLLRLTTSKTRAFVWFCIITLFIVMLPSALLTLISCRPMAKTWNSSIEGECWDGKAIISYGIFNAAWCTWADFALALLPWKLVWGLSLQWKEKVGIGIAMSMGLLAGMCAIIKGIYLIELTQQDFFFNGKNVTIWTAVETATAIVGASIPVLRVFFKQTIDSYRSGHSNSHDHTTCSASYCSGGSGGSGGSLALEGYPTANPQIMHQPRQRRSMDKSGLYRDTESQASSDDSDDDVDYAVDENGRVYTIERVRSRSRERRRRIWSTSTGTTDGNNNDDDDNDQIRSSLDRRISLDERNSFEQMADMGHYHQHLHHRRNQSSVDRNAISYFGNNSRSSQALPQPQLQSQYQPQPRMEEIDIVILETQSALPPPSPPRQLIPRPRLGVSPSPHLGTVIGTTRRAGDEEHGIGLAM